MTFFNRPRKVWGRKPVMDEVPGPLTTGALVRQCVLAPEVEAILTHLPDEGAATHCVLTGRFDLMTLLVALIDRIGVVETMRVSTLSYHASNLVQLLGLLDRGQVKTLNLLACTFFKNTCKGLFVQTQEEFRKRGQRVAAARTHAKVITLAAANGSRWTLEGSANLRYCDCWENCTLLRDATVHEFHSQWIDAQVTNHEGDRIPGPAANG